MGIKGNSRGRNKKGPLRGLKRERKLKKSKKGGRKGQMMNNYCKRKSRKGREKVERGMGRLREVGKG